MFSKIYYQDRNLYFVFALFQNNTTKCLDALKLIIENLDK